MRVLCLTALTVIALGLISAPTLIFAQELPPSQFEHIQGLEPLVGIWRAGKQGGRRSADDHVLPFDHQ